MKNQVSRGDYVYVWTKNGEEDLKVALMLPYLTYGFLYRAAQAIPSQLLPTTGRFRLVIHALRRAILRLGKAPWEVSEDELRKYRATLNRPQDWALDIGMKLYQAYLVSQETEGPPPVQPLVEGRKQIQEEEKEAQRRIRFLDRMQADLKARMQTLFREMRILQEENRKAKEAKDQILATLGQQEAEQQEAAQV